jgi:hypothetical protein
MDAPALAGTGVCQSGVFRILDMKLTTIGIDLAKNVFQLHGLDERGQCALKKLGKL